MAQDKSENTSRSFLFQVDILIQADSNGEALERLLHVLNGGRFADYRVGSGIQLGQMIEEALQRQKKSQESAPPAAAAEKSRPADAVKAKPAAATSKSGTSTAAAPKAPPAAPVSDELDARIRQYADSNKLIRLNVNKGRGVKLSIPCRIVGFDSNAQLLTVYHVDEKQVHTFKLFEIDDFIDSAT
jgi:hypothetical protein